ncbi:hypothetical protein GCM10010365_50540 [Streptomyces poonensis]|uniref:Uncharacterized protein n=1 Tax=Streptomyces poonensis TaxID=68255 RepID=A0A918UNC6_9ACTN|nr:hypothetical protein GCM10010365_50540 [Streptomyces poonensis]GLJ89939.1 hypothetical protein GCM10017589_25400 [Streptomyces poonensis]
MTTPPPTKSLPTTSAQPHAAERAAARATVGEPTGAAREGVPSVPRTDPCGDGRYPVAWLHISAPSGAVPTATSRCLCGRDRSAVGRRKVLALITDHTAHRDTCPLSATQEGRAAA